MLETINDWLRENATVVTMIASIVIITVLERIARSVAGIHKLLSIEMRRRYPDDFRD
jgi:phage terminase Nu1 subunit (DNA packaging protein)